MGRGPIEYIHKAEQLKISEVTERQKLESIRNQKERLQADSQGQRSRLSSLYARLADLEESKDNDSKRSAIMAEIEAAERVISRYESEIQKLISDEHATDAKLAEIERSKEQTLIEIESNAALSEGNMNTIYAAMFGAYTTPASRAAASFQRQISQYSKAAEILGGSISASGGGGAASGSNARYTASRSATRNLFEAAAQQRADSSELSGASSKPRSGGGLGGGKPTKRASTSPNNAEITATGNISAAGGDQAASNSSSLPVANVFSGKKKNHKDLRDAVAGFFAFGSMLLALTGPLKEHIDSRPNNSITGLETPKVVNALRNAPDSDKILASLGIDLSETVKPEYEGMSCAEFFTAMVRVYIEKLGGVSAGSEADDAAEALSGIMERSGEQYLRNFELSGPETRARYFDKPQPLSKEELEAKFKAVLENPKYYEKIVSDSGEVSYAPIWPPDAGFDGNICFEITLNPGTVIDRYGSDHGTYASPVGTPYEQRSCCPGTDKTGYSVFVVTKEIKVTAGFAASWFGEPGGGIQFVLGASVKDLKESGALRSLC